MLDRPASGARGSDQPRLAQCGRATSGRGRPRGARTRRRAGGGQSPRARRQRCSTTTSRSWAGCCPSSASRSPRRAACPRPSACCAAAVARASARGERGLRGSHARRACSSRACGSTPGRPRARYAVAFADLARHVQRRTTTTSGSTGYGACARSGALARGAVGRRRRGMGARRRARRACRRRGGQRGRAVLAGIVGLLGPHAGRSTASRAARRVRDRPAAAISVAEAFVLQPLAALRAMRGEWATARELLAESNAMLAELGEHDAHRGRPLLRGVRRAARRRSRREPRSRCAMDTDGCTEKQRDGAARRHRRDARARDLRTGATRRSLRPDPSRPSSEADANDRSPQIGWRAVRAAILARRGDTRPRPSA